jgi:hypothetical protein
VQLYVPAVFATGKRASIMRWEGIRSSAGRGSNILADRGFLATGNSGVKVLKPNMFRYWELGSRI